jgi:RNA polymerase sigma-70 factor (sigma-E family)
MRPDEEAEYREYVAARLRPLHRLAYLVCGDWHRAEDAVQVALTKLYLHWSRARRSATDAYVRRMVVNALHDMYRRSWTRREHPHDTVPEPEPANRTGASDERLVVLAALAKLPLRRRATLVLRFWEDLSVEETAQVMGCSTATVKSQTTRGLEALRGLLPNSLRS